MKSTTKSFRALTAFVLLGTLAACSSAGSDVAEDRTLKALEKQALPLGTVLDERITELLPAGSYNIEFKDNLGGSTVARGYVHLPFSGDPADQCAYEVDVEQTRVEPGTDTEKYTVFYNMVKPLGPDSFSKIVKIEEKSVEDDSYKQNYPVGVWGSGDDHAARTRPAVVFPSHLLDERYSWCGIGRIDEVARLADPTTGLLEWDQTQFAYTAAVSVDNWFRQVAEHSGFGDKWLKNIRSLNTVVTYRTILENSPIRIVKDDAGVVTITSEMPSMERTLALTLTPTTERNITGPSGVKTLFERLAEGDQEALLSLG